MRYCRHNSTSYLSMKFFPIFYNWENFIWLSKAKRNCLVFVLLCFVIGLQNTRHCLNQSDAKPTPIAPWSPALQSRALVFPRFPPFACLFVWFFFLWVLFGSPGYFPFFRWAVLITLVIWLYIEKRSTQYAKFSNETLIVKHKLPESLCLDVLLFVDDWQLHVFYSHLGDNFDFNLERK